MMFEGSVTVAPLALQQHIGKGEGLTGATNLAEDRKAFQIW
jgi:hypothetical protein